MKSLIDIRFTLQYDQFNTMGAGYILPLINCHPMLSLLQITIVCPKLDENGVFQGMRYFESFNAICMAVKTGKPGIDFHLSEMHEWDEYFYQVQLTITFSS